MNTAVYHIVCDTEFCAEFFFLDTTILKKTNKKIGYRKTPQKKTFKGEKIEKYQKEQQLPGWTDGKQLLRVQSV